MQFIWSTGKYYRYTLLLSKRDADAGGEAIIILFKDCSLI